MEERVAILGIIVEDVKENSNIQSILHEYSEYIVGRMGLPKVTETINVISVVVKAPQTIISAMSGKLGKLNSVTAKAIYSKSGA